MKPETEASRYNSKAYEIEAISWGLKSIAKMFKVPVLALCQMNRGIEGRQDKRPMLSDLRDSGAIEQDSDLVMFLSKEEDKPGQVTLSIAKHRNGPVGEIPLCFIGHLTKFKEMNNR